MGSLRWAWTVVMACTFVVVPPLLAQRAVSDECRAFAEEVVRLSAVRKQQPDEDQAHAMVPLAGPVEQWPTLHWMVRLIYRVPADKLHAEAVRDCLKYHSKPA